MTDRSDEVERVQVPPRGGGVAERVAVVAKLRPGSRERARQILAKGAPYELGAAGFRRHSVFLAQDAAVFVFEGLGHRRAVRDLVDDPTRSAAFSVWGPFLEGTPLSSKALRVPFEEEPRSHQLATARAVIGVTFSQ
jgi:hypothetical protein